MWRDLPLWKRFGIHSRALTNCEDLLQGSKLVEQLWQLPTKQAHQWRRILRRIRKWSQRPILLASTFLWYFTFVLHLILVSWFFILNLPIVLQACTLSFGSVFLSRTVPSGSTFSFLFFFIFLYFYFVSCLSTVPEFRVVCLVWR